MKSSVKNLLFGVVAILFMILFGSLFGGVSHASGSQDSSSGAAFIVIVFFAVLAFCIYFAPTLVAFKHDHSNRWLIAALNVVTGVTLIGWVLLLIWANKAAHLAQSSDGTAGGESGLNVFANDVKRVKLEGHSSLALSTDLQNLERLRASGALTEEEFSRAKEKLLGS